MCVSVWWLEEREQECVYIPDWKLCVCVDKPESKSRLFAKLIYSTHVFVFIGLIKNEWSVAYIHTMLNTCN